MGNKNKDFVYQILLISKRCHIIGCLKNENTFKKFYSVDMFSADNKNTHVDYVTALPTRNLLVQRQQWKNQKNLSNLYKVNNKNTRTTSITSF